MSRRAKRTSSIIYNMVGTPIFGGSIFRDRMILLYTLQASCGVPTVTTRRIESVGFGTDG